MEQELRPFMTEVETFEKGKLLSSFGVAGRKEGGSPRGSGRGTGGGEKRAGGSRGERLVLVGGCCFNC